jgi:hypothetical protein
VSHQAAKVTPDNHSNPAIYLSNLGSSLVIVIAAALKVVINAQEDVKDLEEAMQVSRRAVEITPKGHL